MTDESAQLRYRITNLSDDELLMMMTINSSDYRQEALNYAQVEAIKRGILPDAASFREEKLLEIYARSNVGEKRALSLKEQFIGRCILTNKQLMFLSPGDGDSSGTLVKDLLIGRSARGATEEGRIKSLTLNLNLDALSNLGSWAHNLEKVNVCEVEGSWFVGHHLKISGTDINQQQTTHVVFRDTLSKKELVVADRQIKDAVFAAQERQR